MDITLELLSLKNAQGVYDFEVENRAYFEKHVPPRGDDYYIIENYNRFIGELLDEQSRGECYMYVVYDECKNVVGRVNFPYIWHAEVRSAELGYRIGQGTVGKGVATKAIQAALMLGSQVHEIKEVTAGTSADNIASQRVLEKNGFTLVGKKGNFVELNGQRLDFLQYIKYLQ